MLKRSLFIALLIGLFYSQFACQNANDIQPETADMQFQIEAATYQNIVSNLEELESKLYYPDYQDMEMIIPDNWHFKVTDAENSDNGPQCTLAIPKPDDLKTGLTVERSTKGWIYISRTTYMSPHTEFFICSDKPQPEYQQLEGVPSDYFTYPKRVNIDGLEGQLVFQSPYYIPQYTTHGVYTFSISALHPDSTNAYNLKSTIRILAERNPYLEGSHSPYEPLDETALTSTTEKVRTQADLLLGDTDKMLELLDNLESTFFARNSWCWDKQQELDKYRNTLLETADILSQIQTCCQQLLE